MMERLSAAKFFLKVESSPEVARPGLETGGIGAIHYLFFQEGVGFFPVLVIGGEVASAKEVGLFVPGVGLRAGYNNEGKLAHYALPGLTALREIGGPESWVVIPHWPGYAPFGEDGSYLQAPKLNWPDNAAVDCFSVREKTQLY